MVLFPPPLTARSWIPLEPMGRTLVPLAEEAIGLISGELAKDSALAGIGSIQAIAGSALASLGIGVIVVGVVTTIFVELWNNDNKLLPSEVIGDAQANKAYGDTMRDLFTKPPREGIKNIIRVIDYLPPDYDEKLPEISKNNEQARATISRLTDRNKDEGKPVYWFGKADDDDEEDDYGRCNALFWFLAMAKSLQKEGR